MEDLLCTVRLWDNDSLLPCSPLLSSPRRLGIGGETTTANSVNGLLHNCAPGTLHPDQYEKEGSIGIQKITQYVLIMGGNCNI